MKNALNDLLKSVNKEKLEELKKKADAGELGDLLSRVDTEKANKMIKEFGLSEKVKDVDLGSLLERVKKNPDALKEIKKFF